MRDVQDLPLANDDQEGWDKRYGTQYIAEENARMLAEGTRMRFRDLDSLEYLLIVILVLVLGIAALQGSLIAPTVRLLDRLASVIATSGG